MCSLFAIFCYFFAQLALRELNGDFDENFYSRNRKTSLVAVKKLFVMSAMMFTYKTKKFFRGNESR